LYLAVCLIAVKDWAKAPSDHVDPYHLGIRFVGFLTAVLAEIYLLKFALLLEAICCWRRPAVVDLAKIRSISLKRLRCTISSRRC
jgi:hypothetical protein